MVSNLASSVSPTDASRLPTESTKYSTPSQSKPNPEILKVSRSHTDDAIPSRALQIALAIAPPGRGLETGAVVFLIGLRIKRHHTTHEKAELTTP